MTLEDHTSLPEQALWRTCDEQALTHALTLLLKPGSYHSVALRTKQPHNIAAKQS